MEPFEIACPHCSGKLRVATPSLLGRTVKCPKCTNPFTVPSEEDLAGISEDAEVMEQETAEVGSGVGSGVGVGSGIGVGSGVGTVGSGVGASLGRLGQSFEYSEADNVSAGDPPPESKPRKSSRSETPSIRSRPRGAQPLPVQNLAMVIGIPVALLFFGTLIIFWSKGYLSPGGRDGRQDGSRFVDFARDAEKNAKWVPQHDPRNKNFRFAD